MIDENLYEYVLEEVDTEEPVKKLWAKAIAHAEGDTDKIKPLYMQYRVQALIGEFTSLGIDYSKFGLEEIKYHINLLSNDEWRQQKKDELVERLNRANTEREQKKAEETEQLEKELKEKAEQEQIEKDRKKYGKIGGWLWPFGLFLVLWILSAVIYPLHTVVVQMEDVKILLVEGYPKLVQIIEYAFYLSLAAQFFVILLALYFFKKLKGTKAVAITFFIVLPIINTAASFLLLGLWTTDFGAFKGSELMETSELGRALVLPVFSVILSIISIWYFSVSKRVEKTFINIRYEDRVNPKTSKKDIPKDDTGLIFYASVLPIILLISYHTQKPDNWELGKAVIEQAEQALASSNYDEAIDMYQRAKNLGRDETDDLNKALILKLEQEFDKGNMNQAAKLASLLEKLFKKSDHINSDFYRIIGNKYLDKNKYKDAINWYLKAVGTGSKDVLFTLAYSYNKVGKYDSAIKYYKASIEHNERAVTYNNLASTYMNGKKDCNNAITYARKAVALNPQHGNFVLGYCHSELNYHKSSIKYYKKEIKQNPKNTSALWNMALAYDNGWGKLEQDSTEAFKYYLKAADLGYKDAYEQVAYMYRTGRGTTKDLEKARYWENK